MKDALLVLLLGGERRLVNRSVLFLDPAEVEFQVRSQERIGRESLGLTIIVSFLGEVGVADLIRGLVEAVDVVDVWELCFRCMLRPVLAVRQNHLRPRLGA